MLCDVCKKNEATVHLTKIEGMKLQKVDLCEVCAKEKGVQDPASFSVADLLVGLGAAEEIKEEATGPRCPVCGFTQADFKKTGRLGCSACWETFEHGLSSLLKAMHKGDHHIGKVPAKAVTTHVISSKIQELSEQLEAAVRADAEDALDVLRRRHAAFDEGDVDLGVRVERPCLGEVHEVDAFGQFEQGLAEIEKGQLAAVAGAELVHRHARPLRRFHRQ